MGNRLPHHLTVHGLTACMCPRPGRDAAHRSVIIRQAEKRYSHCAYTIWAGGYTSAFVCLSTESKTRGVDCLLSRERRPWYVSFRSSEIGGAENKGRNTEKKKKRDKEVMRASHAGLRTTDLILSWEIPPHGTRFVSYLSAFRPLTSTPPIAFDLHYYHLSWPRRSSFVWYVCGCSVHVS